jgi:transposase
MCNIRFTSLVSKNNSVSVQNIIEQIIKGNTSPEELACYVHGRIIKSKGELVRLSLDGFIQEHHRFNLELAYEQYQLYRKQLLSVESKMDEICSTHYKEQMELLESIPGVQKQAAMQIIAETGADMTAFENSGKLTGWAGLRPRNDETAGKMKSTSVTKGNKYLRRIMVQCAWAASRTKGSFFKSKFEQLCVRKSRKKALIAVARKMLTVIWHILSERKGYNANILPVYNPEKIKHKINYHKRELDKLEALGFSFL